MGITIGDNIELSNGLSVTNAYGSIAYETVTLTKERLYDTTITENGEENVNYTYRFSLRGRGVIWVSKDVRNQNKPKLKHENIQIHYDDDTFLSQNIYTLLYNEWKKKYTTVTDDV